MLHIIKYDNYNKTKRNHQISKNIKLILRLEYFNLISILNDENLIEQAINSPIRKNCVSFSTMTIAATIPIISACQYYIGNDTGWGHISSGLGLKSLFLFMDSPPSAYGAYSKNISVVLPDGETMESCGHNTRGKNRIPVDKVLRKTLELMN